MAKDQDTSGQDADGKEIETTNDNSADSGADSGNDADKLAEMQAEIKSLRKEAAKYRNAAKKAKEEAESQAPSLEKAMAQIEGLQNQLSEQANAAKITKVEHLASQMSFVNPSVARKFLDIDDLESDSDITNALGDVAKEHPYLLKAQRTDAAAQSGSAEIDPNDWLRSQLSR